MIPQRPSELGSRSFGDFLEIFCDALDVGADDRCTPLVGEKEGHIVQVVHHEVLGKDSWHDGVADDIKGCLEIGISIGEILADSALREVGLGCFVEFTGQQIRKGLSDGFLCRPALRLSYFLT